MGFADIIPGVSGGTMALITGIYEDLVLAVKSVDPRILVEFGRGNFNQARTGLSRVRLRFLVSLGLGIGVALLVGSQFIGYLLDNYPPYTYSFFLGLILASAVLIYFEISRVRFSVFLSSLAGALAAVVIIGVSAAGFDHGLLVMAMSGAIAICAMILPGISGAFILLLLGQYEYVLDAVARLPRTLSIFVVFGLGAAVGLMIFSRLLSYMLERWKSVTLGFLVGLMVGGLRKPVEVLIGASTDPDITFIWNAKSMLLVSIIGLAGVIIVIALGLIRKRELGS